MSRTVKQLKDGVAGFLTGTNVDNITNIYNALERAARTLLQKASIPEAQATTIQNLYDGVYDYLAPTTIFGGALRDIQPMGVSRTPNDYVYRQPIELFDRTKAILPNGYQTTFQMVNGVPIMRIANTRTIPRITLDAMTATTGWVAAGSAGSLVADSSFFYQSPASLRFTLTGASTGTLTKTLTSSLNLTTYQGVGTVFVALNIPAGVSASLLTSAKLRIGSSSANYYEVSVTQAFLGSFTNGDFILLSFDLATATTTGTPIITAMNYVQLSFTHSATMTNVRTGSLWISLPSPHKIVHETTAIFQNSITLAFSNSIGNDNDLINLNDSAYNLYERECAVTVGLQQGGSIAGGLVGNLNAELNGARARNGQVITLGLYDLYRTANPSEEIRPVGNYYNDYPYSNV